MAEHIVVYGTLTCSDCRRAKLFLDANHIVYQWIDITDDAEAIAFVERVNRGHRIVPTIVFPDGSILIEPSNAELAEKTQTTSVTNTDTHEVVIVGGGPCGLTAAIYAAREGLKTLVIDQTRVGGQVATTQTLDNFPPFENGITGDEFITRLELQARRFEADIIQGEKIVDILRDGQYLVVRSSSQHDYVARSVLIAAGRHYKRLNIPGERELIGSHIHFCATCDGPFYRDKDVLVIGGGNSGFEEGLHLMTMVNSVSIVEYQPLVRASRILQDTVAAKPNMRVIANHAVREFKVKDGNRLAGVVVENRANGELTEWNPDGVFVFIGSSPSTDFLPSTIERDEWGFIKTDAMHQTSMAGVFAAGDVRAGSTKQAISAAGEGATAALMIRHYLHPLDENDPAS